LHGSLRVLVTVVLGSHSDRRQVLSTHGYHEPARLLVVVLLRNHKVELSRAAASSHVFPEEVGLQLHLFLWHASHDAGSSIAQKSLRHADSWQTCVPPVAHRHICYSTSVVPAAGIELGDTSIIDHELVSPLGRRVRLVIVQTWRALVFNSVHEPLQLSGTHVLFEV